MARGTAQEFGSRYEGVTRGERFVVASPSTSSGVVGGTAFASATPIIAIGQTSADKGLLIDYLTLSQNGTLAGGTVSYLGFISDSDRVTVAAASGGTELTPANMSMASVAVASVATAYESRNIGATTGTLYPVFSRTAPAALGTTTVISFEEGLHIPPTGSFLVYAFAGTPAPTVRHDTYWREYRGY